MPIKAIAAIIQHNTSGFASPVDRNIITPKDFEGKKYGGWGYPMEIATLKGLMESNNGDFNQLEMVDIGALDFFIAVESHVDFTWIYYGWDGGSAELRNVPINFISLKDQDENMNKEEARQKVIEMLPIFELEGDGEKYPTQLSGGMKQRVSLLRAYMFSKEIMLLDEPFGGLDAITRLKMQEYLLEVLRKIKGSVLFITHDIDEAIFLSDRIYIINGSPGHIVEEIAVPFKQLGRTDFIATDEFSQLRGKILKLL